jgi:uncharacterized glyoxalase superfamily protein PhnB
MKFGYTVLYVENVAATIAFYEQAFGFQKGMVVETGEYGELITGSTSASVRTMDNRLGNVTVCLW